MGLLSNNLIRNISEATSKKEKSNQLATVTRIDALGVYLTYYGETEPSQMPTKRLNSYSPAVGDVVLVANINGSKVITGKVV